ncbi:MAG: hypothetical protein WCA79_00620 [Anaerolineales bacterium]
MVDTIDLTNYIVLDAYGLERRKLEGNYSKRTLAQLFIDEWLPWYDGYDICPRSEYCKFPESNITGIAEIQCGVVEAIRNFVGVTFQSLNTFNKKQIQGYLDGAYYLTNFLFEAELNIGRTMDATYIRSLKDWAPAQFGRLANLRENLDSLSAAFAAIPEIQSYKGILLVEGESEKAFIETLKQSHVISYLYLNVNTYQGKSNRGHPKLRLLLQRYVSQGYIPYIQGDADGKATNIFDALIQKSPIIKKREHFCFQV